MTGGLEAALGRKEQINRHRDVADIWRESDVWYQGRSRQQAETEYETCSNNEWREVSRSHSTKTVANVKGRTEL